MLKLTRAPIASIGFAAMGLAACSLFAPHYERPAVSVVSLELRKGNFLQQNFALRLHVENPNDRALPVRALRAELDVAGDAVASGTSDRAFVVPAHGAVDCDMTVTANLAVALLKLGAQLNAKADGIDYELTGEASVDLTFIKSIPFHQRGTLPLRDFQ